MTKVKVAQQMKKQFNIDYEELIMKLQKDITKAPELIHGTIPEWVSQRVYPEQGLLVVIWNEEAFKEANKSVDDADKYFANVPHGKRTSFTFDILIVKHLGKGLYRTTCLHELLAAVGNTVVTKGQEWMKVDSDTHPNHPSVMNFIAMVLPVKGDKGCVKLCDGLAYCGLMKPEEDDI
jgi:hypothetical protein